MKTNFDGIKKTAEQNFREEITTKTDYWYYITWAVIILGAIAIANEMLGNPILNYFVK